MREDGFELDKFVLARNKEFKPEGKGPAVKVKAGQLPAASRKWPRPRLRRRSSPRTGANRRPSRRAICGRCPAAMAMGSGTLAKWIQDNLDKDAAAAPRRNRSRHSCTAPAGRPGRGRRHRRTQAVAQGHAHARRAVAHERDNEPNPFTDCALTVTFTHESGSPSYKVPGYFAADGNAAETSAEAGTKWRAHLAPDKPGTWTYAVSFVRGKHAALDGGGAAVKPFDGLSGSFKIAKTDKTGPRFPGQGPAAIRGQTPPPVRRQRRSISSRPARTRRRPCSPTRISTAPNPAASARPARAKRHRRNRSITTRRMWPTGKRATRFGKAARARG